MCFVVPCLTGNYTSDAVVQSNRIERRCFLGASRTAEFGHSLLQIPPTGVGGSFKSCLQAKAARPLLQIPPTGVGGSFKSCLQAKAARPFLQIPPTGVGGSFKSCLQTKGLQSRLNHRHTPNPGIEWRLPTVGRT